jgi:hypothetical protein
MSNKSTEKRLCSACERGEHWDCGQQSWCQCDCETVSTDYSHDPELDANGVCRICGEYEPE